MVAEYISAAMTDPDFKNLTFTEIQQFSCHMPTGSNFTPGDIISMSDFTTSIQSSAVESVAWSSSRGVIRATE